MRQFDPTAQWEGIAPLRPGKKGDPGRSGEDNRRFIEAVLGLVRTGRHGAIYRRASASGTRCGNASGDGRSRACSSGFSQRCRKIPIFAYALIDGTIVKVTGTAPVQKGIRNQANRQIARRTDDQDCRPRRRAGQLGARCPAARPTSRQRRPRSADHRHRFRGSHRRQSFRQQRLARHTERAGRCCRDPSQSGSHNPHPPRHRNG